MAFIVRVPLEMFRIYSKDEKRKSIATFIYLLLPLRAPVSGSYSSFSLTTSASCGVDTSKRIELVLPIILWTVLGIRVTSSPSLSVTTLSFRMMSTSPLKQ